MGEGDSTVAVRSLEPSISFGRFENDLLSWEKWSAFSQNKYLEEVEKCATPGSVAEKKAFFEARNKLIAVRKAEIMSKQMEACQESSEGSQTQDAYGSEVNRFDEEVIDENAHGSELSRSGISEQPELLTGNVFMSQEPYEEDASQDVCTSDFADEVTNENINTCEANYPLVIDNSSKDIAIFESKSKLYRYKSYENIYGGALKIYRYDSQYVTENAQDEPILDSKLSACGADHPSEPQTCFIGSAQTIGGNQAGDSSGMDPTFDIHIDNPEGDKQEASLESELGPIMFDQLTLDNASPTTSSSAMELGNANSNGTVEIPALETEKIDLETKCDVKLPDNSKDRSAHAQKVKNNTPKSFKKILSVSKQTDGEFVGKTKISTDSRSFQMSTPKISKSSSIAVKSASQSLPVSRTKKTAVNAVPKSPQFLNTKGSSTQSTTPSVKPAFFSPLKKGPDSLPSRKNSISASAGRKPTPTSLHMSLNYGSKISGSISVSESVNGPRRSLFMEKMGDKDIVKRAFRAFQNMSIPLNSLSYGANATSKQVAKNKTDVKPSTPILQKEKQRLIKKDTNERIKKPSSMPKAYNLALHSEEAKRKELKTVTENTVQKEAAKTDLQSKHKEDMRMGTGQRKYSTRFAQRTKVVEKVSIQESQH